MTQERSSDEPTNPGHVNEQLLIARYLFQQGVHALESQAPYSPGLSISLFQDAAELVLACVAHAVDANVGPRTGFLAYWDVIESAPRNTERKQVPSKAAMARLNTARVAFKHHGQRPHIDDTKLFRVDVEVFLKEITSRFFGREFEDVAITDLISSPGVRAKVQEAERHLAEGDFKEGLMACGVAALDLSRSFPEILPEIDRSALERAVEELGLGRSTAAAMRVTEYIAAHLSAHREALMLLFADTEIEKYLRFISLTPRVSRAYSGKLHYDWPRSMPADAAVARAQLKFCIEYVTEHALRLETRT